MGMCKVNGPEALPLKPAGEEKLGHATKNICEQGFLYGGAKPFDYGQRVESPEFDDGIEFPNPGEVRHGQDVTGNIESFYLMCHRKRGASTRTFQQKQALKAARKARKAKRNKAAKIHARKVANTRELEKLNRERKILAAKVS